MIQDHPIGEWKLKEQLDHTVPYCGLVRRFCYVSLFDQTVLYSALIDSILFL